MLIGKQLPLAILMQFFTKAYQTLIEFPENQVSSCENQRSAMKCRSDQGYKVSWYIRQFGSAKKVALWSGYMLNPSAMSYCSVESSVNGQCNLIIYHRIKAAQTYICFEPGTLQELSAELIFIENDPICNDNSVNGLINLTCTIDFRGNWEPTMEWREHNGSDEKVLSVGVNTLTISNQRVTSTLVMPAQKGSRNYTCTTKFDLSGKQNTTTATNVPDYKRSWTSSVFIKAKAKSASNTGTVTVIVIGSSVVIALLFCVIYCILVKRGKEENKEMQPDANRPDQSVSSLTVEGSQEEISLNSPHSTDVTIGISDSDSAF